MASMNTMGPQPIKTSNTPFYWGIAILTAVIIAFAVLIRSSPRVVPTPLEDPVSTAMAMDTTPPTNTLQKIDPSTGRAYPVNPASGAISREKNNNPTYDANRVNKNTYDSRPAAATTNRGDIKGMPVDPRAEDSYNGANSVNGGIAPNTNPATNNPNSVPPQPNK